MLPADLVAKLKQCAATDFSGPRDHWFNWLAGFTTMVAVGLVLEAPELVYELKNIAREMIPYFRYRIIARPHREHAAKVAAFIGWILIVAGVAGERVAEVKVKNLDVYIQECSDAKVREATLEAGDAQTSASRANASADAADVAAGKAKEKAEAVSKRAEEIDADLAQTQWLMSARTVENRTELAAKLKERFKGRDVVLSSYIGDQEGWGLCTQLWYVAHDAEMKPVNDCGKGQLTVPLTSPMAISGPDVDETMKIADLLN